ncbi:hypothetical protein JCM14720_00690 [Calditerricola yamamurae]
MDFALTEEHRQVQALARRFAREVIAPAAAECDRTARFPHAIVEEARALGLVNLLRFPRPAAAPGPRRWSWWSWRKSWPGRARASPRPSS